MRRLLVLSGLWVLLLGTPCFAAPPRPFDRLPCRAEADYRFCEGSSTVDDPAYYTYAPNAYSAEAAARYVASLARRVPSWDGTPIDVDVTLPATGDGPWPLVVLFPGLGPYGKAENKPLVSAPWARRGYITLAVSPRGMGDSCGSSLSRAVAPAACARGWAHLSDARFEVRDAQYLAGLLADQGLADPRRVAAVGGSYGGSLSLMMGALRDRVMLRSGRLRPWRSPKGRPMRVVAVAAHKTWSDLPSALAPNGRFRDDRPATAAINRPIGVSKAVTVGGLLAYLATGFGFKDGYVAPPGADSSADLVGWTAAFAAGEPYDGNPVVEGAVRELEAHHSALGIPGRPAPVFFAQGFTDDLFPADQALRYADYLEREHPQTPMAMMLYDFGHPRGQNKGEDNARARARTYAWIDRFALGERGEAIPRFEVWTQTCPKETPSEGPFRADSWRGLAHRELAYASAAPQTVLPTSGDPQRGAAMSQVGGATGTGRCVQLADATEPGSATYDFAPAAGGGFVLLGSPTVTAQLAITGPNPQLAAHLWDVAPDGTRTLVSRGVVRPEAGRFTFQLNANAYRFLPGHRPKLVLLGADVPYLRPANGAFTIRVSDLRLTLPAE